MRAYTIAELEVEADRLEAEAHARRQWGPWCLDTEKMDLVYQDKRGRSLYFVDLYRMNTSAAVLDWIFQLQGKPWCSSQDIGDMVAALRDILNPQSSLCSLAATPGGHPGKEIDAKARLHRRYGAG